MHRGLPVTPVARTLVDFAGLAGSVRVRKAVAEADFQRRLDLDDIESITRNGLKGSASLRRALTHHSPEYARTLSPLEDRFLDLCRRHRLQLPEVNVELCGYLVDVLWRGERLVVELDGSAGHGTDAQRTRDHARDLALRAAGYRVHRYSWRQVTRERPAVAADIRRALGSSR